MAIEHIVTADEDGLRADKIISANHKVGYTFLQKIFRTNKVKVNGKKTKPTNRLTQGDTIKIFADISIPSENIQKKTTDNPEYAKRFADMIIFENENMLAINKPINLAVQRGTRVNFCVEDLMKPYHAGCKLVHRLDKDTSGILLIAKNTRFAREITRMFRENLIKKTYLGVVDGKIKQPGIIDNYLDKGGDRIVVSETGQHAVTKYRPLKTDSPEFQYFTLLELNPETGRKHQLRVHCAESLNAPILGDKKYNKNSAHNRLFLHAYKLEIEELNITLICSPPVYFPDYCEK